MSLHTARRLIPLVPAPAPAPAPPAERGAAWSQRLQLLLESTGEGIFGIDQNGCCTFINRAGAQMLGWRTDQALGRNMHALIHHTHAGGRHWSGRRWSSSTPPNCSASSRCT